MGQEQFGQGNVWASAKESGIWKDVPFNPANFGATAGMIITIPPANVLDNRYCRIGNTIHWHLRFFNASLSGVASNQINLVPPTGVNKIARQVSGQFCWFSDGVESIASVNASKGFAITVFPFPVRVFTLNSIFQLKMLVTYEYGSPS